MASGSNAVVDVRSDDDRGFSGAEVDVELEFIAQREKAANLRRQGKRNAGQWEAANQGEWNFIADDRRWERILTRMGRKLAANGPRFWAFDSLSLESNSSSN